MSRNRLSRGLPLLAVAMLLALACTDNPITSLEPSSIQLKPGGGKGGGKGGGGKTEPLSATVVVEEFSGARVTPDRLGPYIDGQDRVGATVDQAAGLNTDIDKSHARPDIRFLCLDFSDQVTPGDDSPPAPDCYSDTGSATRNHENDPDGVIGMGVNSTMRAGFFIYFLSNDATMQYWLRYCNPATKDPRTKCTPVGEDPTVNLVTVTRGMGNDWTVEAGTTQIARLHGQSTGPKAGQPVFLGDYRMPFQYTITGN